MIIPHDPDEYTPKSKSHTCAFHIEHPGKSYAGCTCSSSYWLERRPAEDVAAIKAERRRRDEDEILAKAEIIRAQRALVPREAKDP